MKDLFATIRSPSFLGIFDPANFVAEGLRPFDQCWRAGLDSLTHYFHIKDTDRVVEACVPAGEGQGQIPELLADLKRRGWGGYMTLEPHLSAGGQFAGFTGPALFAKAAAALQKELRKAGMEYR